MAKVLRTETGDAFGAAPPPRGGWLRGRSNVGGTLGRRHPRLGSSNGSRRRSTAGCLIASVFVFVACSGGDPAPETQDAADRPEPAATEEQEPMPELEPTPGEPRPERDPAEGAAPPAARGEEEPRGAEGAESAGGAAPPEPGAAAGAQPPAGAPQQGQAAAEGVIAVTGTDIDARPVLQTADGALGVTGDLTAELRRLSGARVRVEGERRSGRMPGESIDVSRYTVLEVNGERPEVGTITLRDGTPWLASGGDTVRLIGASDRLAGLDAAKVWITGRRTDEGLEVGSYGVIRR